jgi:hypothetical protein
LLIDQYGSYIASPNANLGSATTTKSLLENYVKSLLEDNTISIKAMVEFLMDLESTDNKQVKQPNADQSKFLHHESLVFR